MMLSRIHFPVTSLGPGRRVAIWFQGCSIGCPGCVSRDTWQKRDDTLVSVEFVIEHCRRDFGDEVEGITISGGEPFDQAAALAALLDGLTRWRKDKNLAIDFLCFSGLPFARLRSDFPGILDSLDAIIPEPYVNGLPTSRVWRGSSNQPLIPLSELGRERYQSFIAAERGGKGAFQVVAQAGHIWFVGIPGRGDMDRLAEAGRRRGIVQEDVSWRA